MKVVLIVGHSEKKQGAYSPFLDITEFKYNYKVANKVMEKADMGGEVDIKIIERTSYNLLPLLVNSEMPSFIVSLHCNSYKNEEASGTEVLYHRSSIRSAALAKLFQKELVNGLGLKDRGVKPVYNGDRGDFILRKTIAPAILVEPGFFSNKNDCEVLRDIDFYSDLLYNTIIKARKMRT